MSSNGVMGNGKSKNIPLPPPLPPPIKSLPKNKLNLKTRDVSSVKSPAKIWSKNSENKQSPKSTKQLIALPSASESPSPLTSNLIMNDEESTETVSRNERLSQSRTLEKDSKSRKMDKQSKSQKMDNDSKSRKEVDESTVEIVRNDVPFFNEEQCSDSEDEFRFPCCLQPNSPRFPPNPRPYREWDPAFLPSSTTIPTSIGKNCRRCGKPVYVAELYLSSRGAYHSECYKCCLCGKTLDSWSVAEFKGEVFCKGCYRRNFGAHGCGFGVGAGILQTP